MKKLIASGNNIIIKHFQTCETEAHKQYEEHQLNKEKNPCRLYLDVQEDFEVISINFMNKT